MQPQAAAYEQPAVQEPAQEEEPLELPSFGAKQAFSTIVGFEVGEPIDIPGMPSSAPADAAASAQPAAPAPQQHGQPEAADLVRKQQHGDPMMRRMGRGVRSAFGGSGAQAAQARAAFADLMQRSVPSYRQIAVASVRGGAGKTTMASLVASEIARHRGDRVLAADADAELGSLPLRLGVRTERSLFDLAGQDPRSFEEAAQYLARTPEGLWVLSSTRGGKIAGEFDLDTFQSAMSKLARYMSAVIVDCGAGILTDLNRGILATTHSLVLVTPGTVDGALSARGALEWFMSSQQQALLGRTVIAMVSHASQVGTDLERAHQMLSAWGLPVVHVPYDRNLATGTSLDLSKIGSATGDAVMRVAYEAFARSLSG